MAHRLTFAILLAPVVAPIGTVPARAETTYRTTVSPATVHFPHTRELTYRLEISTGDRPERLVLEPREPSA